MDQSISIPLSLFYAYAHEDEALRNELDKHLSLLQRQGIITAKHDRLIVPGADWTQVLDHFLNEADIILLLISSDFLASDYCYGMEMQRAFKRHQNDEARVIPILLRPVDWQSAPFHTLQVLPTNEKPVTSWSNLDAAFADIATGIRQAIKERSLASTTDSPHTAALIWNIPFPRNLFFTGRDDLLTALERALQADQTTALSQPQAMSGLGGVGKTQVAVEYAYRRAKDYEAVLWISAASRETLLSGFASLTSLLQLPERYESDQQKCVVAVHRWLQRRSRWLLILDNADDLSLLPDFFPSGQLKGHILLTTRAYALGGLANRIEVDTLDQTTGTFLLLHRAGLLSLELPLEQARDEDRLDAQQIWQELGGLPLALDQAGAYIEETQCGLPNYLRLFRTHRSMLLKQRGGVLRDHPDSVYTTFTLAVKAVAQRHPAAEDLLWVCALMYPDAIPEEVFLQGASHLGSRLELACGSPQDWNALLGTASAYSLLKRQPREQTLSVHRLMQAVLQEHIPEHERVQWTHRIISALDRVLPENEYAKWSMCERLVPHILNIEEHTHAWENAPLELASLLHRTAYYLSLRARYKQAEPLYQRALHILEHQDPDAVIRPLINLGAHYGSQGKNELAQACYQQALHIWEKKPPRADYLTGVIILTNLSGTYCEQGEYEQAELLSQRALHICEQATGPNHPDMILSLDGLAYVYQKRGQYEQAEPLYQRALHICEQALEEEHHLMTSTLSNLANLYQNQEKYEQAELLYRRVLRIRERMFGLQHRETARIREVHDELLQIMGRYEDAVQAELALHEQARTEET